MVSPISLLKMCLIFWLILIYISHKDELLLFSFSLIKSSRVIGTGTFGCGTFIVEGEDFIAENITFENSAPQVLVLRFLFSWHKQKQMIMGSEVDVCLLTSHESWSQGSGQAVAVRVTADRCAFYNCRFLGWQVRTSVSLAPDSTTTTDIIFNNIWKL